MSSAHYIATWSTPYGTEGTHMNNTIQYKGYVGSVEFSEEDGIFYGKVLGIRSLIPTRGKMQKNF